MKARKLLVLLVYTLISLKFTYGQSNTPCTAGVLSAPSIAVGASCTFTSGTTAGATAQTNAANGGTPSCGSMGPDVWYQFTAPALGSVLIQTQAGSITDGVMALYSGTCGSFTQISCSDDVVGLMPQIGSASLTPGATYLIRFWQYGGGTGTFDLCVSVAAPPAGNTTCTVQTPICSGSPINFTANTGGADASTVNPGNSYGCLFTSPNPSWYYLEIATPGTLTVDITAGSDVDFAIWGPFASVAAGNAACNSYAAPSDCSYSSAAVEQVNIAGTVAGQVYVLLVTNYANTVQNIAVTNAGGTATTNCAIVLPVGFSAWDAVSAGNEIRLSWTTENETNNDYFAVQRSEDGLVWETLGLIEGAGTSSEAHNYSFTDQSPVEGINYYRLMQVDNNGQYEFSQIRSVNYSMINKYQISPNPTKAYAFVTENGHIKITSVELIDQVGRVQAVPFDYLEGGVNVDCRAVSHGTYFIRCTDELGKSSASLLVIE
ncbi:T9SS type A sorting domain-containing protein [Fluviicola sp.]|uniref:T9SS type A sorting domain-containing protein n=1 Tax=Fluviicola sp. TaxID=1917219 RepID=UPI003D2CCB07